MALAQQGKNLDEKLLDNYTNRGTEEVIWKEIIISDFVVRFRITDSKFR